MSILSELLEKITKLPLDGQVKQICDSIFNEEKENISNHERLPKGPNIFLSLPVPNKITKKKESEDKSSYLSLEREQVEQYIVSFWEYDILKKSLRRMKVWEVDRNEKKAESILKFYAQQLMYLRGE